jgi:hypothetical protein
MTTTSEQDSPPSAIATIVEDDGTVHRFTGPPTDMQAWLVSTEDRLRNEHGIPAKIAAGQNVRTAGWALLSMGLLVLIGHRLTLSARGGKTRRSDDGAGPPVGGRRRGVRGTAGDQAAVR